MKKRLNPILTLFSGIQILIYMFAILLVSGAYLFLITKNMYLSIGLGIVTMIFGFYHSVYFPKKLEREQYLLKELQKYATTMTFYMQSGYNVLQSLDLSRKRLDKEIRKDVEKTMIQLQEKADLDTSHFERYKFAYLDIFHQILKIKYDIGGDAKELFSRANESINFEIVKRDELYRKKKYMKTRVFMMMGMTASMPLIFVFFAPELYEQFLSMRMIANAINVALFIAMLISLFFLQRTATNISIYD